MAEEPIALCASMAPSASSPPPPPPPSAPASLRSALKYDAECDKTPPASDSVK
ncbi:hypothetical protein E4U54_004174, partial [Claviceps lovelessii]